MTTLLWVFLTLVTAAVLMRLIIGFGEPPPPPPEECWALEQDDAKARAGGRDDTT